MIQNTVEITNTAQLATLDFNPDPWFHLSNTELFPTTAGTKAPGSLASVSADFKCPRCGEATWPPTLSCPLTWC